MYGNLVFPEVVGVARRPHRSGNQHDRGKGVRPRRQVQFEDPLAIDDVYNYQKYSTSASDYTADYDTLRAAIAADTGGTPLPLALTEYNVRTGLNYDSRTQEFMTKLPPAPTYFHKPITALNSHKGAVVRPQGCKWLNYEGEVAIVIGRTCRNVSHAEAAYYIAGYTVANDYGLHDFRDTDSGSMLRVKGADTLCPIGPGLITDWDFRGKRIRTLVNGVVKQDACADDLIFSLAQLISHYSQWYRFQPGDVVTTGSPPGVGFARNPPVWLKAGDTVTIEIEGIGALTNPVVDEKP